MAQYKVLQDIEAEDKLLGPLSLRQFIYAAITIALGFVSFRLFITSVWFLGFAFVPPALFFGLLAAPLGGQQSSEVWLLAKIRFFFKPRRRIWDQTGLQQLVTVTAPKKIERQLTKGYSQDEVKSRLKTLAVTLDTRGWAVKNVSANMYATQDGASDRLLDIATQDATPAVVDPTADILDPSVNPRAKNMDQMIQQASTKHRDTIMKSIENAKAKQEQAARQSTSRQPEISQQEEKELLDKIHRSEQAENLSKGHLKVIEPAVHEPKPAQQGGESVTPKTDPAIMKFVKDKEGLSVQTTAGLYNRMKEQGSDDEVVISLH